MALVGQKQYQAGEEIRYGGRPGTVVGTTTSGFSTNSLYNGETRVVKTATLQRCLWSLSEQIENYNKDIEKFEARMDAFKVSYSVADKAKNTIYRKICSLFHRENFSSKEELNRGSLKYYDSLNNDLLIAKAEKRKSGHGIRCTSLTLGSLYADRGDLQSMEIIARRKLA